MVTYQDFLKVGENKNDRMTFIRSAVAQYQATEMYRTAKDADLYDRKRNPDIAKLVKTLYTVTGKMIPDNYSSDYKMGRAFFPYFVTQEVQYLLGNGVNWENNDTGDKLGTRRYQFDTQLQDAGHKALVGGCAYGFWNFDHIEVFSALEFVPLLDEDNGSLRAGIRYWQIDETKPFRATLYEEEGYTDYIWNRRKEGDSREYGEEMHERRPYVIKVTGTDIDEDKIYQGENYEKFPIVPLWGNKAHQSEIVGLREQIFIYDVIKSGFANNVEDASYIYWGISNAPGMDEVDLADFLARLRRLHVALTENGGASATPHQIDTPTQARETLLDRMEKDIFKDAMAFDPMHLASGAVTATQIKAAYNPLDMKTDGFEYCVLNFVNGILDLAGIDDNPTFTRSRNVNVSEEVQTVLQAGEYLDEEYVTRKILDLLGDGDQAEELIQRRIADEVNRQRDIDIQEGDVDADTET